MYHFIILLGISVIGSAEDTLNFDQCVEILHTQGRCCEITKFNKTSLKEKDMKECELLPKQPGSCDRALCYGTKLGFVTDDGTLKMDLLQKHFEEKLSDYQEVLVGVKTTCLDGSFKYFGEADECDLMKIEKCVHWQFIFRCQNFSKDESCKDFKDAAEKCLEVDY